MSTNYYKLKHPLTSIKVNRGPGHFKITLWINHAQVGHLTLRADECEDFIQILFATEPLHIPVRTFYGGESHGLIVEQYHQYNSDMVLLSESDVLTTVEEVCQKEHQGKCLKEDLS